MLYQEKTPGNRKEKGLFSAAQNTSFVLPFFFFLMWQEEGKQLSILKL